MAGRSCTENLADVDGGLRRCATIARHPDPFPHPVRHSGSPVPEDDMVRVFIIDGGPHPFAAPPDAADAEFAYDRITSDSFEPDHLHHCTADLVVVIAGTDGTRALRTFEWLKTHSIPAPIVAVLPGDSAHDLLEAAAAIADDFVVQPVDAREWHHR